MGGPFGISGFDKGDKKIGTTTLRDLQWHDNTSRSSNNEAICE